MEKVIEEIEHLAPTTSENIIFQMDVLVQGLFKCFKLLEYEAVTVAGIFWSCIAVGQMLYVAIAFSFNVMFCHHDGYGRGLQPCIARNWKIRKPPLGSLTPKLCRNLRLAMITAI